MRTVLFWLSLILIFVIPWENVILLEGVGALSRGIGLFVAAFWVATVAVTGRFRKLRPFHLVVLLFLLWNVVSVFWSVDINTTLVRSMTCFQLVGLVLILWDTYTTPAALRAALQVYVLGAYVSIYSLVSNYLVGIEATYSRYSATGFNSNAIGFILALGIPVAWYLAVLEDKKGYWLNWVNYAYIPAAVFSILLTSSRAAAIAILPAFVFIFMSLTWLKLYQRVLLCGILIGSLFVLQPLVPESSFQRLAATSTEITEGDLNGRLQLWREGFAIFSEHPLFGVGSGAFVAARGADEGVPHNFVLSLLTELGIIGFSLFATILAMSFYHAIQQPKWSSRLWLTILMIWFLNAATHNYEYKKQTWLFLSLMTISSALYVRQDESRLRIGLPVSSIGLPKA